MKEALHRACEGKTHLSVGFCGWSRIRSRVHLARGQVGKASGPRLDAGKVIAALATPSRGLLGSSSEPAPPHHISFLQPWHEMLHYAGVSTIHVAGTMMVLSAGLDGMTIGGVADYLTVTERTIYRLAGAKQTPASKARGSRRFSMAEIDG